MASTLLDLVAMTVSSAPGTSPTIPLGAAATVNGITYLSFSAAGATGGSQVTYSILDTGNSETGTATYTSSNATLTSRTPTKSTNGSSYIAASSAALILASARAEDIVTSVTAGTGLTGGGTGGALSLSQFSCSVRVVVSSDNLLGAANTINGVATMTLSSAGTYFVMGVTSMKTGLAGGSRFFSRISDGVTVINSGFSNTTSTSAYTNCVSFGVYANPNGGALTLQAIDNLSSQGVCVASTTPSGVNDSYFCAVRIG